MTGHTTPGVVSSIVSSEALQADLLQAGEGLQRPEEVSEDLPAHEDDRGDYENREGDHEDLEDDHEDREDNGNNQMFDSYWPKQNSGNEPITVSSQDSSQEGIYEVRYGAVDDPEDDHEVNADDREEPEVISDSDSEEDHEEYPIDRFIPIQDDSDDPEVHDHEDNDHPSVEIVEPEGLHIYQEGEYEGEYEDEEEHEDEIHEDSSMWQRDRTAPPPRRISSSSDEVICLDSD